MPEGKIAGFDRPLVESEIIVSTAFSVSDEYDEGGELTLENSGNRADVEDEIENFMSNNGGRGFRDITVKLTPSGSLTGAQFATGRDEILSEEQRRFSLEEFESLLMDLVDDHPAFTGFRVPNAYNTGFGDYVDEPYYSIECK